MSSSGSYPLYDHILVIGATSELFSLMIVPLLPYVRMMTCVGRNHAHLEKLKNDFPQHVTTHVVDLLEPEAMKTISHLIASNSFDALVQLQGFGHYGLFETIPSHDHEKILYVNLTSVITIANLFITHQKDPKKQKVILHAASLAGLVFCPYLASYGAAKAGLHHFTQTIALELGNDFFIQSLCPKAFGQHFSMIASSGLYRNPDSLRAYTAKVSQAFVDSLILRKKSTFCTVGDRLMALLYFAVPQRLMTYLFKRKMKKRVRS